MVERFGDGREREYRARPGGLATEIPVAVLINRGSASAAEIVASVAYRLDRRHRQRVMRQLAWAFPEWSMSRSRAPTA